MINAKIALFLGITFALRFSVIGAPSDEDDNVSFDCTNVYHCTPEEHLDEIDDGLIRYKSVLISFRQIVKRKISRTVPAQKNKGSSSKLRWKYGRKSQSKPKTPSEMEIYKKTSFQQLQSDAYNLVKSFEWVFLQKYEYVTRAYDYRLLQWLKFSMRRENVENENLEDAIQEILHKQTEIDAGPNNVVTVILSDEKMKNQCTKIEQMNDLETFGNEEDKMIAFCLLLKETKGQAAKDTNNLMPSYNHVERYEELLSEIGSTNVDIFSIIGEHPCTLLAYVYDAAAYRRRRNLKTNPYKRPDGRLVRLLPTRTDEFNLKYYLDVMTVFDHALENKLLPQKQGDRTFDIVLQLENFPLNRQGFQEIRGDAFEKLAQKAVYLDYDNAIIKPRRSKLAKESILCYDRLLEWLFYYLTEMIPKHTRGVYDAVLDIRGNIRHIWRSYNLDPIPEDPEPKYSLRNNEYLHINTVDLLINFCTTGKVHASLVTAPSSSRYHYGTEQDDDYEITVE